MKWKVTIPIIILMLIWVLGILMLIAVRDIPLGLDVLAGIFLIVVVFIFICIFTIFVILIAMAFKIDKLT